MTINELIKHLLTLPDQSRRVLFSGETALKELRHEHIVDHPHAIVFRDYE